MPGRKGNERNFIVFLCKNIVPNYPSLFRASTWNVSGIIRWLEYENLNLKTLLFFGEYYDLRSPEGSSVQDGIDNASWWNIINFQCYHQSLNVFQDHELCSPNEGPGHQLQRCFRKFTDEFHRSWGAMPEGPHCQPSKEYDLQKTLWFLRDNDA